jgi:hypothetical protein
VRLVHGDRQRPRGAQLPTPVSTVNGATVVTLEGLGTPENPHPIQKAFIDAQAAQCGFCLNGVILTAKAFLDQNPKATDEQIHQAMSTVLCRCFTTTRMMAPSRSMQRSVRDDFDEFLAQAVSQGHRRSPRVVLSMVELADKLGIAPRDRVGAGWQHAADARLVDRDRRDGNVTVYTGRADMGQGTFTVQYQLAAEELVVPMNRIRLVECDTGDDARSGHLVGQPVPPGQLQSREPRAGVRHRARSAGRDGRDELGAPPAILNVADGVVDAQVGREQEGQLRRADWRQAVRDDDQEGREAEAVQNWTVLARSVPRVDMPALATGRFEHVHNVRVPGMVHGRMVRPAVDRRDRRER